MTAAGLSLDSRLTHFLRQAFLTAAILAACITYVAFFSEYIRHSVLIVTNIILLPVLSQLVQPHGWIHSLVVVGLAAAAWLYEGMREIFVGLALFQAVPSLVREIGNLRLLNGRPKLTRTLQVTMWLAAFVGIATPILTIAGIMFFNPGLFEIMIRDSHKASVQSLWRIVGVIEMVMGIGSAEGASSDPYRVLGLALNASERDIQKRWRALSLQYHPDRTGNDPLKTKHFLRLQKAMQVLISGKSKSITSTSKDIMTERLVGLVSKSVSSSLVVCIWIVVSVWMAVRKPAKGSAGAGEVRDAAGDEQLRQLVVQDAQRALADPKVKEVLADPVMQSVFGLCITREDPEALRTHMQDEDIVAKVEVLVAAGFLRRLPRSGELVPNAEKLVAAGLLRARAGPVEEVEMDESTSMKPTSNASSASDGAFAPTRVGGARRRKNAKKA